MVLDNLLQPVTNTMSTSKRLTSSFFTSILLCIGVVGVLQLFVLEDGLASRAMSKTRFSDSCSSITASST